MLKTEHLKGARLGLAMALVPGCVPASFSAQGARTMISTTRRCIVRSRRERDGLIESTMASASAASSVRLLEPVDAASHHAHRAESNRAS